MATISRARRTADTRSCGKMVRGRRITAAKTPYDRPTLPPPPPLQNPNWLTGLIFPTTRMIASGAGKLLSSVFAPDTSSSSSSSSDSDSGYEDDVDNDNDDYDIPHGVDGLNKNGTSSETMKCSGKEPQLTVWNNETKRVIERLLMQETFSREECDRLIKIICSRVVDYSTIKEGQDARLSEMPSRTACNDIPDLCSKAVMEAKKWLEEKKMGSSSKSDLNHETCTFNSVELLHVTEGEVGSPVDMAKSYMQARPPWFSPSISHIDLKTPPPVGIELFKGETPYSVVGDSFSLSKKRDSLSTGSWNILEEIRRVRSKATEDMLRTVPYATTDLSPFALEAKTIQNSLVADKTEASTENEMYSNSLTAVKTIDASLNLAAGVTTSHVFPEMTQGDSRSDALPSNPAVSVSEQNQIIEGGGAASESHHSTVLHIASNQHTDSRSSDRDCSTGKEVNESRGTPNANGLPSSGSSLSAGLVTKQNPRPSDENPIPVDSSHDNGLVGHPNPVSSSHDKSNNSVPVEETCQLLSEASIEVPVVNETNSIASGSQNSSSMRSSQELTQLNTKRSSRGKTSGITEKQQGRKLSGYNRKGRGRGK
uniref:Protein KAKU4 n=1 Tax=Davidia involucrata TaxID=16924 RepID=A0A5B6YZB1_DAVIN